MNGNSSSKVGNSVRAEQEGGSVLRRHAFRSQEKGGIKEKEINANNDYSTSSFQSDQKSQLLEKYAVFVFVGQIIAFFAWTGAVLYCTYRIYAEAFDLLPPFKHWVNSPGPLSEWLQKSWDPLDAEWNLLGFLVWTKLICYFILYKFLEYFTIFLGFPGLSSWMSPVVSLGMICELLNMNAAVMFYAAPVTYWFMMRVRRKFAIWTLCLSCIVFLNSPISRILLDPSELQHLHLFGIIFGWNISRCVSFCLDVWDRPETEKFSLECLGNFIKYIGYVPLVPSGPLILYHHFENKILKKDVTEFTIYFEDVIVLLKSLMRLFGITCLLVVHQYFLYYRPLAYSAVPVHQMSLWALCGSIYWLGQSFSMKYKILYGVPSAFCELDGMDMYPLPCCIAYVHRYSALWKDFDRGLYLFLVRYIYIPMVQWFKEVDPHNKLNYELKKFIASFTTFGYIFVWHSISYEVFIWTAFNFLGVTVERIGSAIKRRVDGSLKLDPLIWDFLVEPLVCVPLAAMSILNSSVFCGSLDMATHFSTRLWVDRADNYSWHFLYFFCHCGVAVRNWPKLKPLLKEKLRISKKLGSN